jgi:hypothetical protein
MSYFMQEEWTTITLVKTGLVSMLEDKTYVPGLMFWVLGHDQVGLVSWVRRQQVWVHLYEGQAQTSVVSFDVT